mmetsp:Transcript_21416/g.42967  ORF Transcript_21416/g.42967 Transcript_21416/m.42967 type:complete len:126 (-) Transcript_21416:51-428(-)
MSNPSNFRTPPLRPGVHVSSLPSSNHTAGLRGSAARVSVSTGSFDVRTPSPWGPGPVRPPASADATPFDSGTAKLAAVLNNWTTMSPAEQQLLTPMIERLTSLAAPAPSPGVSVVSPRADPPPSP